MPNSQRLQVVSTRVSLAERRLLEAIAVAEGKSLSATVRRLLVASAAQRVSGPELVRDIIPRALADMGLSFDDLLAQTKHEAA